MSGGRRTLIRGVALSLERDPDGGCRANGDRHDVLIEGGVVASVVPANAASAEAPSPNGPGGTARRGGSPGQAASFDELDGAGLVALGGFTDLYGRLREPGPSGRGTLASETRAALAGGFTRVLCSPDTTPVIDDRATLELIRRRTSEAPGARVLPMAALTRGLDGMELAPLATLKELGCPAAGQADRPLEDANVLLSAMQYAASFELPLIMTARDARLGADGCAHDGAIAARLGLPGIPVAAETVALARLLELARESGCRLHVSRLSSARGVELVAEAKAAGLAVTADVGMHHLLFTDAELAGYDARYRSEVPFRSAADRAALREGVRSGVVDAICSDHAPHDDDARLAAFPACAPGLAAYDHFLPALLALPALLDLPVAHVLARVTDAPSRVLGLDPTGRAGRVVEGTAADLVLVDPRARHDADASDESRFGAGRNTPLPGVSNLAALTGEHAPFAGAVRYALVGGEVRLETPAKG